MKQTEIDKKWIEDEADEADEAEHIKLEVGESVEGLLVDKFEFDGNFGKKNWGYIIKAVDCDKPVLLFGCAMLNKNMVSKSVGDEVCIERLSDKKNSRGLTYQVFKTYHK